MLRRDPERNGRWAGGMPGGARNPLGARALYLFKDGKDTLYRIHGTTEPWSIGEAVSSGCIRMLNQDVIDLHRRVPTGTKVVVLGSHGTAQAARPAAPETTGSLDRARLDNLSRGASEAPEPLTDDGVADDEGL